MVKKDKVQDVEIEALKQLAELALKSSDVSPPSVDDKTPSEEEEVCPNCDKPKKPKKEPNPQTLEKKNKLQDVIKQKYPNHPLLRKIKATTKGASINSLTLTELDDLLTGKLH